MCTVTLSYDQNNALARRKLAALLATGLFSQQAVDDVKPTQEEVEAHRQLRDAALELSRKNMSHIIARYVWNTGNIERDVNRRLGSIKERYFNEIVDKIVESIF